MSSPADATLETMVAAGLSPADARYKLRLLVDARAAVGGSSGRATRDYVVPGRIEVLGKHTDYAGGRSLLCAVERAFVVSAAPRSDDGVVVTDIVSGARGEFRLRADQPPRTHWQNYPAAVTRRMARNFAGPLRGVDLAFGSDLPRAAGLSSSTALIVGLFAALADRNELAHHPDYHANVRCLEDLAGYLGAVENGRSFGTLAGDTGVGTRGGSQDHTAILCARRGHLVGYTFAPVAREREVPLPDGHTFVVASSGVTASKAGEARERYNRGPAMVAAMLARWRRATGTEVDTLGALHRADATALATLRGLLERDAPRESEAAFDSTALVARLDQFIDEALAIVPEAAGALAAGDLPRFGALVDRSQAGAERGLGNQVPETVALARSARALGAVAASAFGAGFGGSVWALVGAGEDERFVRAWRDRYTAEFPAHAARVEIFRTGAAPPLIRL